MKNAKFDIRVFVLSLLLFFGFAVLYIRANTVPQFEYDYEGISRADMILIMGYDIDGNNFEVSDGDPKIIFDTTRYKNVYGVRITFDGDAVPEKMYVYYAGKERDFMEAQSVVITDNHNNIVEIGFPIITDVTRLDIDEDFVLRNIEVMTNRRTVSQNNILKYVAALAVSLILASVMALIPFAGGVFDTVRERLKRLVHYVRNSWKKVLVIISIVIFIAFISVLLEYLLMVIFSYDYYKKYEALLFFVVGFIIFAAYLMRGVTAEKPQYLFVVIAMTLGIFNIVSAPRNVGLTWDDEIHYGRTVYFSYGAENKITYADLKLMQRYSEVVYNKDDYYSGEGRDEWYIEMSGYLSDNSMVDTKNDYAVNYTYVTNVAPAMGLIIGRGLGLSYNATFMLGKFMNLLTYTCVFYVAASLLKNRGKYIVCLFGLIPTLLFMASSYSYDGWVVSMAVLGYAMFIAELQKENGVISMKKWIAIMAVMILAFLPKAVYFPMIFPMLFIGKKVFDEKHRFGSYVAVNVGAMLLLLATFVLPMIIGGAGTGDSRGGLDVNSSEQIAFILNNPLKYTDILLRYLGEYLAPDKSYKYLTLMGYYGRAGGFSLLLVVFAVVACIDNRIGIKKSGREIKSMMVFCAFGTICIVVTALYISFTAVGAGTVSGVHWRYQLPVLFPLIYFLSEMNIDTRKVKKGLIVSVAMIIMAAVFVKGIADLCLIYY